MSAGRLLLSVGLLLWAAVPARGQVPYRSLDVGTIRVSHLPGDSLLASRVLQALREMPPLPGLPGVVPAELEVVLAATPEDFAGATGGQPPHWSAGVALPGQDRIVLPVWSGSAVTRRGAASLLRHEWAHVAVYRGSGGRRAPRWFTEGYAEWAGGWDRTQAWRLRVLLAVGRAPALDSLTLNWPGDRTPAESAYLLAASVVEYLVEASGERGLETLFQRWREVGRFEEALRRTYGLTSGQLEDDWRRWARERYGWLFVLTHSSLAWGLLALLLALTAVLRRRHNRERMARLRAREIPESPAYWTPGEVSGGPGGGGESGDGTRGPDPPGPPDGTS